MSVATTCENNPLDHDACGILLQNAISLASRQSLTRNDARLGKATGNVAQDPDLTARMRSALRSGAEFCEKRMMGDADRSKDVARRFMFRIGKDRADRAAELGAQAPVLLGDRIMPGANFVEAERCDDAMLGQWLALALENARRLPPK